MLASEFGWCLRRWVLLALCSSVLGQYFIAIICTKNTSYIASQCIPPGHMKLLFNVSLLGFSSRIRGRLVTRRMSILDAMQQGSSQAPLRFSMLEWIRSSRLGRIRGIAFDALFVVLSNIELLRHCRPSALLHQPNAVRYIRVSGE